MLQNGPFHCVDLPKGSKSMQIISNHQYQYPSNINIRFLYEIVHLDRLILIHDNELCSIFVFKTRTNVQWTSRTQLEDRHRCQDAGVGSPPARHPGVMCLHVASSTSIKRRIFIFGLAFKSAQHGHIIPLRAKVKHGETTFLLCSILFSYLSIHPNIFFNPFQQYWTFIFRCLVKEFIEM